MLRNAQLKTACRKVHDKIIRNVNPDCLIDFLYKKGVLSDADNAVLVGQLYNNNIVYNPGKMSTTRLMLSILHNVGHPEAFISLHEAIAADSDNHQLVEEIAEYAPGVPKHSPHVATVVGKRAHIYSFVHSFIQSFFIHFIQKNTVGG